MAKQSRLLHQLESLVGRGLARAGLLRRTLKFIFLAALGLILAVAVTLAPFPSPFTVDAGGEVARAATPQELIRQGRDYYQSGKFEEAAEVLQNAAAAYEDLGNPVGQSQALSYLSLTYRQLGNWDKAEAAIAASLQKLSVTEDIADSERRARALALNARGRLQLARGQAEAAFATWEKAAKDYKQLKDREGSSGARLNQAQALEEMGRYRRSCNILLNVLSLENQTCDRLEDEKKFQSTLDAIEGQPNSRLKAGALRSLGNVLRSVGQLDRSGSILQESLEVAQDLNSAEDESLSELYLGNTKRALAKREKEFGNDPDREIAEALEHYQKAEAIATSPTTKLLAQLNQLRLLAESEDAESSEKLRQLLEQIQTKLKNLPKSSTTVKARINLACNLIRCDRLVREVRAIRQTPLRETILKPDRELAKNLLDEAVSEAIGLESRRLESYAIGTLGKWYEYAALGQGQQKQSDCDLLQEAEKHTRQALKLAEESEAKDLAYQWQWQMGRLLRSAENVQGAIASYTDAVENLRILRKDLQVVDANVQFDFRDNVDPVYRGLVDLLLRKADRSTDTDNIETARKLIDELQLAELANFLQCDPSSLLQKGDKNRDLQKAAVIYTIILPDRLEVILELPGQILKRYPHSFSAPQEAEKTLSKLRKSLATESRKPDAIAAAKRVYQWLIAPLEGDLENSDNIDTLVFVLDGQLRNIPVAVLYDAKNNEYLVEKKYALAILPNSSLFDLGASTKSYQKILAAGISDKLNAEDKQFDKLDGVSTELENLKNKRSAKILENSEVTKPSLSEEVNRGNFSVVHLATHGSFSSNPEQTYILVYRKDSFTGESETNSSKGELLKGKDFDKLLNRQGTSNPLELLVLSACETLKGDNRAALGLAGVAVRSGVRSTVATLWQVNDESTAQLMDKFYEELGREEVTKAEALHRAQKSLLETKPETNKTSYDKPYFWAPYVLVGNWR